ncbi:MAG: HEAT repeat domain-containing protein [Planctomycetota bacterium]
MERRAILILVLGAGGIGLFVAFWQPLPAGPARNQSGSGSQAHPLPADRNQPLDSTDAASDEHLQNAASNSNRPVPSADADLPPERAIALGVRSLRILFPPHNPLQQQILALALAGDWTGAIRVALTPVNGERDADLLKYLLQLRASALYLAGDVALRAHVLQALRDWFAVIRPIVRAAVFEDDPAILQVAIRMMHSKGYADEPCEWGIARLEELTEHPDPATGELATRMNAWLKDGVEFKDPRADGTIGLEQRQPDSGPELRPNPNPERNRQPEPDPTDTDPTQFTPADLPALILRYRDGDTAERRRVAFVVQTNGWKQAAEFATTMLADTDEAVRRYAILLLVALDNTETQAALVDHFPGEESLQPLVAKGVLQNQSNVQAKERMVELALASPDSRIRNYASSAIEAGHVAPSAALIVSIVEHNFRAASSRLEVGTLLPLLWQVGAEADVRYAVAEAVAHAPAEHLVQLADHIVSYGRGDEMALLLGRPGRAYRSDREIVGLLARLLDHSDPSVRIAAVTNLHRRFGSEAADILIQRCVMDVDDVARATIAGLATNCEHPLAGAVLLAAVRTRKPAVEDAVLRFFERNFQANATERPVLRELLASAVPGHRARAMRVFIHVGTTADIPELAPYLTDPELNVVLACLRTLEVINHFDSDDAIEVGESLPAALIDRTSTNYGRIEDRKALWSVWLGRLAAGDLDMAAVLADWFPRVRLPMRPDEISDGPAMASRFADYLQIPVRPWPDGKPLPLGESVTFAAFVDGAYADFRAPARFYNKLLAPRCQFADPPAKFRVNGE